MGRITTNKRYLERKGVIIDTTSIDEKNISFAGDLFYTEFGYRKRKGDKIVLLEELNA